LAATSTRVSEERKLRDEIAKANREYKKIKQRNKNFNVDLDEEEAAAETALENAKEALETYKQERQESLTQKGNETKVKTLQTRILSEQSRLEGLKSPDREGGFLIAPATEDRVRNLEKSIYEKEQEIKRLGGELRTPTKFDLYKPAVEEQPQPTSGFNAPVTITGQQAVSATPKDRPFSGTPSPTSFQAVRNISNEQLSSIMPRSGTIGLFDIPEMGEGFVFLAPPGATTSVPIDLESWKTNVYDYTPQQIQEYKRAIGFKEQSGAATPEFVDALTRQMLTVSEINYRNARNNKRQISFEEYVVNPQKFGGELAATGAGRVSAGPSAQELRAKNEAVKILATEIGVGLDDATANRLAREWAIGNYDATSIRAVVARSGTIDFTKGAAAQTLNNLRQYAADFGVQYDDTWFNRATTNILTAKDNEETYAASIRQIAKSRYPTFAEQIDGGFTVRQLASPYIQTMSSILELDSGSIGLNDPFITQAMTGLNTEGKPATKPLWQFEQELRKDPRWNYTNNAQQSLMNTARQVLQDFGLVS
jgi:hypothetical protein